MLKRSFLLVIISIASIVLFFTIPVNYDWLYKKVYASIADLPMEANHMSIDDRKQYKYRESYLLLMQAADFLSKNDIYDPVVLLPPNAYIRAQNMNFVVPEPVVFYYYTGYRAVWANSPDVESANWALLVRNGKVHLGHIKTKEQLQQLLLSYKNYTPAL